MCLFVLLQKSFARAELFCSYIQHFNSASPQYQIITKSENNCYKYTLCGMTCQCENTVLTAILTHKNYPFLKQPQGRQIKRQCGVHVISCRKYDLRHHPVREQYSRGHSNARPAPRNKSGRRDVLLSKRPVLRERQ